MEREPPGRKDESVGAGAGRGCRKEKLLITSLGGLI